ncbi:MAG: invasin domain 3-containing protein [Gemmatimonadota bacterium]|nr:invasin domain 3-containing protein [Gemmatimonadota bacterium]MDQ8147870.1 invasin domain 3-containing protein [Gemmatimonadota bacterium]MDQ8157581.1 invasin domain 3-containing protein [Gemmatimonadota bacterium]MDQ8177332.1 invasin domain 3-containing protein [Gemmatimonadota bacterium]
MRLPRPRLTRPLFALLALGFVVGSCGRELTGPAGSRRAVVALQPQFAALRLDGSGEVLSVGSIVPFTRVRVVLLRANGDTAIDRVVEFPADADSLSLSFPVTLSPTAPADGEPLGAVMRYLNASGDTVFASAPVQVQARTSTAAGVPPVVTIPLTYVGPGSTAASLVMSPDSVVGVRNQAVTFGAVARNAQGAVLANTPVAYTSTDTTLVRVGLSTGAATLVGVRGTARVIAQTLTGPRDTALVRILPTPTTIAVVSGNTQQVRQASVFAQPLRVRVTAADGLGVAGAAVDFAVTAGRGTVSAARVTTDTAGVAQVTWTAGDTAMVGTVVASVTPASGQSALSTTFSGTQLSSGPTSLGFAAQPPATVVAGDTLTSIKVVVLDATLDTVRTFTGAVTLTLTGGTTGASLLGTATVNAVAGVARFPGLSVNRAGTGYRLTAQLPTVATVPTVQSAAFAVSPAPPALVELLTGANQTTVGGTTFGDSIRVWVKDRFGIGVGGASVGFTIAAGNGSVSPAPATTNASGIAAAAWTAGPSGRQTVDVVVAGVAPVRVLADAPSTLGLTSGSGQFAAFGAAFAQPIVFTVRGDSGRVLAGIPVAFTITGGGSLSQVRDTSDGLGVVSTTWTAGTTAGSVTLTANIPGTAISAAANGQQASAAPAFLAFSIPPRAFIAGDSLPTTVVAIYNGFNELLPNYRGSMSVALTGGTPGAQLIGTTTVPVDSGASAGWFRNLTVDRAGSGYRLVATLANPVLTVTSDTFSVGAAPAAGVVLTSGGGQSAVGGATLPAPIVVTAVDRFGFPVRGATVGFSVTSGGGTVAPTTATTDSLGRASAGWTVGVTGLQRLSVSLPSGVTPLVVAAIIPQALTLVGGGGQSALFGSPFPTPISFRVFGDSARPMAGIPVEFSVFGGGGLSQVRDTSDANGLVSVIWTAGTLPGAVTLTASVPGMSLTAGASGQQASPAPSVVTLTGAPAQIVAGDSMPAVQVQVLNGLGQPATTYTGGVRLTLGGGTAGAQLLGTTVRQAISGVATFTGLSIDRAGGGYRLFAALDPAQAGLQTNSDTITVTPAPATGLVLVSGGGQTAPEFIPLADSIVVRVVDRFGFGVPGVTVQFAVQSGGGSIPTPSAVTSGGATPGRAAVRWTVGPVGAQQLKVTAVGLPDLLVNATSLPAGGPPVLFIGQGDGLSLRVGQPQPVTLFLSSPSPSAITVNFSTSTSGVANWEVPSFSIPAGQTQVVTELLPVGVGQTMARINSSAGSDSILVYVDSAVVGFRLNSVSTSVGDTVRTQVVLDAPAPVGGVTATVTSLDPATLLVAAGSGRGLAEAPECTNCFGVRAADDTTAMVLGTPGATATIQIPAGQIAGEVILLPIAAPEPWQTVDLRVTAPGRLAGLSTVYLERPTLVGFSWSGQAPVGHLLAGEIQLNTPFRRRVTATVRSLDPGIVLPVDSVVVIDALANAAYDLQLGRTVGVGSGRLEITAPGFVPDTIPVTVVERSLVLDYFGSTGLSVGQIVTGTARLGTQPTQTQGFISDAPPATPVPVTFTALDTTIVQVLTPSLSADSTPSVQGRFRAVGTGTTSVIATAPTYGADTLTFLVGTATPTLSVFGPLTSGLVASLTLGWQEYGFALGVPTDFTITVADTSIVAVLTPSVRLAAGMSLTTVRLEGKAAGSTVVTISAPGMAPVTQSVSVVAPTSIAAIFAPSDADVGPTLHDLSLYLDGETAVRQQFRIRATAPTTAQVIDSIVTIAAGGSWASARFRALAEGQVQFILSTLAGVDIDTSMVTLVNRPAIGVYGPGLVNGRLPIGRSTRSLLTASLSGQAATGLTVTVRGPLGTTISGADTLPLTAYGDQPFFLNGPATLPSTGNDTVTISRVGSLPVTIIVEPATIVPTLLVAPVGLGQLAEVSGYIGLVGATTQAGYEVQLTAPLTLRLVSLDTTRLRVEQDTVRLAPYGSSSRFGLVRAVGTGAAALTLQPFATTPGVGVDTTTVFVERARLFSPFYAGETLELGMQQRTFEQEVYIDRGIAARKPLWVKLKSSAPTIASVPDSVLIPSDSIAAFIPVTGGDTVGTARITASAGLYIAAGFDVRVQRTRLAPHAPFTWAEGITTGGRTTLDVYALAPDVGGTYNGPSTTPASGETTADLQSPVGGTVRPSTVPIPIRVVIADTTVLGAVARDTATIPVNGFVARMPGLVGKRPGRSEARIEDRRATVFARLTPAEQNVLVEQAALEFVPGTRAAVPFLALTAPERRPLIRTTASADSVVVQLTSRLTRVGLDAPVVTLVGSDSLPFGPGAAAALPLRGLAIGVDTLIATAPGHRPDTLIVNVTGGAIDLIESDPLPASLRVGDSLFVPLGLRDITGGPVAAIAPITLAIATSPTVTASVGPTALPLVDVDGGEAFTCGRRTDGQVYCWGQNAFAQLGIGSTTDARSPALVGNGMTFTSLTVGYVHACGLATDGKAYCWGDNGYGQLGNGTNLSSSVPTVVEPGFERNWATLSAGGLFTCGTTTTGEVFCWGRNNAGQLGNGVLTDFNVPVLTSQGTRRFSAVSAGSDHACAIDSTNGTLHCWGNNQSGKLGDGTTLNRSVPTAVSGSGTYTAISAGGGHTCGILTSGGATCWGANNHGSIGSGSFSSSLPTPTAVAGGLTWTSIASGGSHTCGVASGNMYCWGLNSNGQVGDSTLTTRRTPVLIGGEGDVVKAAAGGSHSCGIGANNEAACWGANQYGQIGDGTVIDRTTPTFLSLLGSGSATSVTIQPGMFTTGIWLKGVSAGPATLTVTTPNFATFQAALTVRAP